jgi:hypothetical protein
MHFIPVMHVHESGNPKDITEDTEVDDARSCQVPWYNKTKQKAYIKKGGVVQEAMGIMRGPHGIAMAIFVNMAPIEIPTIRNEMLDAKEEGEVEDKKEGAKKSKTTEKPKAAKGKKDDKTEEAKKSKKPEKPEAANEVVKCGAHKLPDGWTTGQKKYKSGAKVGTEYKIWVAPDGTECDRWSKVESCLAC